MSSPAASKPGTAFLLAAVLARVASRIVASRNAAVLPIAAALLVGPAFAQPPTCILELLGAEPQVVDPAYVGVDLHVTDLGAGSRWTAGGLFAEALHGATFVYAVDPNLPVLTRPDRDGDPLEDAEKFVTFVSRPRARDALRRFRAHGEPLLAGKFIGGVGPPLASPTVVDVAYFDMPGPPDDTSPGYTARIVLDISGVSLPFGAEQLYAASGATPDRSSDVLLATVHKTVATDIAAGPDGYHVRWWIFAPGDCDHNGIPDSDEPDCDGDGVIDACQFANCDPNDPRCADCDANGNRDACDIANCPPGDPSCADCNGNGIPDGCELRDCAADPSCADCDGNGVPDGCQPDCDNDGIPDVCEIANCDPTDPSCADCNGNGVPDACDIADCGPNRRWCKDCDGNGVPDVCQPDCDGDRVPDVCQIANCDPGDLRCADCDADGVPDGCQPDCDGDGIPDACEIANCNPDDPSCADCDGDGVPDGCQPDCDNDGIPNTCEIANCDPNDPTCQDCDANGQPDGCQPDCNGDGIPDACQPRICDPRLVVEDLADEPQAAGTGLVGLDINVIDFGLPDTYWTAGGLAGRTFAGAAFVYASDPNGVPLLTAPDRDGAPLEDVEKYVTFVSKPRGRDAAKRFRANGEPSIAGSFGQWGAIHEPGRVEVAFFDNPGPPFEARPGYTMRVILDISGTDVGGPSRVYAVRGPLPDHPDDVLLASGQAMAMTAHSTDALENMIEWSVFARPAPGGAGPPNPEDAGIGGSADCNHDGVPDNLGGICDCGADLDDSGHIDLTDLTIVLANMGGSGAAHAEGDVDGDSDVDLSDVAILLAAFGCCCGP